MLGRQTLTLVAAALGMTSSAMGQLLPTSILGLSFSAACQESIIEVVTNSSFAQCFPIADLLPILTSNASIIPYLDMFMTDICYNDMPCSNDTLMMAASTILSGCASDLATDGLPNATVTEAFDAYPLVREVLCLKTSDPYTNASYGGTLGEPPIPITPMTYNSTNGTFCVTSVLTQLSAYFGANITLPYIETAIASGNSTAVELAESINVLVLCNDCIFGAVDIIEEVYPFIGELPISEIFEELNMTTPASLNTTINGLLNGTCAYVPLVVTENGTLPTNITESIINSTFPFNVTDGM